MAAVALAGTIIGGMALSASSGSADLAASLSHWQWHLPLAAAITEAERTRELGRRNLG